MKLARNLTTLPCRSSVASIDRACGSASRPEEGHAVVRLNLTPRRRAHARLPSGERKMRQRRASILFGAFAVRELPVQPAGRVLALTRGAVQPISVWLRLPHPWRHVPPAGSIKAANPTSGNSKAVVM